VKERVGRVLESIEDAIWVMYKIQNQYVTVFDSRGWLSVGIRPHQVTYSDRES